MEMRSIVLNHNVMLRGVRENVQIYIPQSRCQVVASECEQLEDVHPSDFGYRTDAGVINESR